MKWLEILEASFVHFFYFSVNALMQDGPEANETPAGYGPKINLK